MVKNARTKKASPDAPLTVAELFAGVGGFRLALEGHPDSNEDSGFKVVWANQWEPPGTKGRQFAFDCYVKRFDPNETYPEQHCNEDIAVAIDKAQEGLLEIPDHDLLCGGFPCQDYSVAKPLMQANGIKGKKGVLWWEIYRLLTLKKPRYLLLENVDRMLKSPASQRGRDFAIMLSCLAKLGYSVEWRVINAADYGFPQRRRRVYIYGERKAGAWDLEERVRFSGVLAEAFPIDGGTDLVDLAIGKDTYEVSETFGSNRKVSQFLTAGAMQDYRVLTTQAVPIFDGEAQALGSVLIDEENVPEGFYIDTDSLSSWHYLKGAKKVPRVNKKTGHEYIYSEGSIACPDDLSQPSRTILTGEGGRTASRFKHIIQAADGRYRRLVPEELEQLQGFPIGWTDTGMSDANRAFCMGNALVVGIPARIGEIIRKRHNLL
jgi:DNA (cytosine-5)-methyltransferase 1